MQAVKLEVLDDDARLMARVAAGDAGAFTALVLRLHGPALGLATRWPDPFPRIFGYHEVWHTLVVAAVVCQFVAMASIIHAHTPA